MRNSASSSHPASATTPTIVDVGRNCWRADRADQFYCIQDGADYFALVRQALLSARETVFILGWDIFAGVDLLPDRNVVSPGTAGRDTDDAPTKLDELLRFVAKRRPRLHVYILIWDYAALYTLERDPWSRWRLGWRTHRRVHFGFDDRHPVGGSHHQKIVVVDDQLAFSGGIDLTSHRWDTCAHRVEEPARVSFGGEPYTPYHDLHTMVSGPVAASLGTLARDRWRALGEDKLPPVRPSTTDLWPRDITPDLREVDVAIARTLPGSETQPSIRECERLFVDSIAAATRCIYVESQYCTNKELAEALAVRLREPNGPEVIVVTPSECHGWLEQNTMGAFRYEVFKLLIDADAHKRLRLVYPAASRTGNVPTFVHSKAMIVDDRFLRIGSANFSRRSMGVDSECDLAVDAGDDAKIRDGIRTVRDRLLGEHLDLSPEAVAIGIERAGSMRAFIDSRQLAERTLVRIDVTPDEDATASEAARLIADPDEPIAFGTTVDELVPPADATNGLRPLRLPTLPLIVLAVAVAAVLWRPELQTIQGMLTAVPGQPWATWVGIGVTAVASVAFMPLEALAIAAGLCLGLSGGVIVAFAGAIAGAALGYALGRLMGPTGLPRWMSRQSYRSARQLGARGTSGMLVLRLASVATSGSIHLLSGAGRVPFTSFITASVLTFVPAILAFTGLGALLRHTLLDPTTFQVLLTVAVAVLVIAGTSALRTLLLIRQFTPSLTNQRARAEFG